MTSRLALLTIMAPGVHNHATADPLRRKEVLYDFRPRASGHATDLNSIQSDCVQSS